MFQKIFTDIPLWQFEKLASQEGLVHFVSGRQGGVSSLEKGPLNLSFSIGDDPENVKRNRQKLCSAIHINYDELIIPVQTHSSNIGLAQTGKEVWENTDALITNQKGLCIAVMSADCVPVLLYDPKARAIATIHAGWKGTVAHIVSKTIQKMQATFHSRTADIIAAIGPSICQEVYEVGPEVIEEVVKAFGRREGLVAHETKEGKGHLNLWEANRMQLLEAGLNASNIEVAGICTYKNDDQFFSARKSKNTTGRFAAGIMLN